MLQPIREQHRRSESELWRQFETARPRILGALLDAAVRGLQTLPDVRLASLPRMADFALWAIACDPALWPAGTVENHEMSVSTVSGVSASCHIAAPASCR